MPMNENFRKKYLLPVTYCGVLAMAIWSANAMVHQQIDRMGSSLSSIEAAAGDEVTPDLKAPSISEADLQSAPVVPALEPVAIDAEEAPPLRISPDKPEVVQLDRDAINVIVGSEETLRAVPDTNRSIILIPKKPGATYFKATDAEGKVIMQRHVIVGAPNKEGKYLRIRRACSADAKNCKEFSVFYCPDLCHEVNVVQGEKAAADSESAPIDAPTPSTSEYVEPAKPSPQQ